ncbi:MAG: MBL fold metallo-hydrolase [Euryarchaeota archaeon]|jgi:glyoxylase-like metal-dependent hydrolase (beta-lactamase superfamily II)|nr:MBL fold metallo-hydrolase [Euryarchaeota archaeon]
MQVEDIRPSGWACAYLVSNGEDAVLIDPVWDHIDHYLELLEQRSLTLIACMATHTHADHITACFSLSNQYDIPYIMWKDTPSLGVTLFVDESTKLNVAGMDFSFHHVPGHTQDSMIIEIDNHIFTGDFFFNGEAGVGRDDLPSGRLEEHWSSLKVLTRFSDDVLVCSGHEPPNTEVQSLGWNRTHNPILSMESPEEFVIWQKNSAEKLGDVSKIKVALPANIFAEIPDEIPWL